MNEMKKVKVTIHAEFEAKDSQLAEGITEQVLGYFKFLINNSALATYDRLDPFDYEVEIRGE